MPWNESLYLWLIHSAIVSFLVLVVGTGAVLLCRRPARQVWIIELTLAGCLIAPWLGTIPGYPRLGFCWPAATSLHQEEPALPASAGRAQGGPTVVPQSHDLPVSPQTGTAEAAPRATNAPSHYFDLASWIVTIYAVGVALGLGWWLVGLLALAQTLRMTRPAPSRCRELLDQFAGQRASRVKLLVSRRMRQPFAFALRRPVIVLPEDLCGDDRALRWSLAHEWTHIERHDFRAWLLAGLTRVLFFYHPLIWWLRYQLRLCQDFLADDRAARQTPQPEDYAEFLTGRAAGGSLRPALVGLGMGASKSELYRRVVMLVQNRPLESRVPWLWTLAVTCAAFVLVATMGAFTISRQAAAQGEPSTAEEKPAPVAPPPSEPLSSALLPAEPIRKRATQPELAGIVYSVRFTPDGKLLASGWGDSTIKLWDVATRKNVATFVAPKAGGNPNEGILIRSVAFSPDGRIVASANGGSTSGGRILLWDVATGNNIATFNKFADLNRVEFIDIYSVAFSPDGKTLASGCGKSIIRLWDVASSKILTTFKADSDDSVYSVTYSPDGKTIASGGRNGTIKLWDVTSGKNTATLTAGGSGNPVYSLAFSPDGRTLAAGCNMEGGMLWDVTSGKNTAKFKFDRADSVGLKSRNDMVYSVAFSPDGKTLGLGCDNGLTALWDVTSAKKIAVLRGHTALVRSLAFSPNGDILASGSDDSNVKLWNISHEADRTGGTKVEAKPAEAEARPVSADQGAPVEAPRLLYLTWEKDGIHSTGKPIPHTLWDRNGTLLSDNEAEELLKKVRSFDVAWRRVGELHPLVFVFKVDRRITHCPVQVTVITAGGNRYSQGTARNKSTDGLNVSAAAPSKSGLKAWPDRISLEIKYPVESVTPIRTLTEIPDEPLTIAPGIQWYLDPTRAQESDPETHRLRRATGKTAAVLQVDRGRAAPLLSYNARVYLRDGDRPLSSLYSTIIEPNGKLCDIDVSEAFTGKNEIKQVEITRQRYDIKRIENVPVRLDLLPEAGGDGGSESPTR